MKDAGIAIRHSRGRILFYTAGSRNEFGRCGSTHRRKLYPRKTHFFLLEKYVEDARQDEKHVPDLLESIMRPTDPVKEELQPIRTKHISKIKKITVSTFWIPEIQSFPTGGQCQPAHQKVFSKIWPLNISKNEGLSPQGPYSST